MGLYKQFPWWYTGDNWDAFLYAVYVCQRAPLTWVCVSLCHHFLRVSLSGSSRSESPGWLLGGLACVCCHRNRTYNRLWPLYTRPGDNIQVLYMVNWWYVTTTKKGKMWYHQRITLMTWGWRLCWHSTHSQSLADLAIFSAVCLLHNV